MADSEEYFPRGGKKPTTVFKQSANFLGDPEKGDKKKNKNKKKSEGDDGYLTDEATREIDQSTKNCTVGLSYQTIKEGVLVLGRVRYVYETKMIVMLPCRLIGNVMACHISEPYNKQLEAYVNDKADHVSELPKMFRPGQYIAVKVLEHKEKSLMLSTMPQHVNGGKPLADIVKGSLFQAAVMSIEDHGYVMDLGIPNTTTFLPKKDVNPELELDVGMVTWCAVKSVTPSTSNTVVTLSATLGAIQGVLLKKKPVGPLMPGTNVEFNVETPLDNGIEGMIFGDITCYVQRQHVDKVKGKKPTLGQKIRGRVLYVLPTRNTPFLTMKSIFDSTYPDMAAEQRLKDGDIIEQAQVLKIIGRSVHLKLGNKNLGLLSMRRIQVDEDLADEEVVAKSYPIGSKHKVRILCYNMSDYVYSVTDQPHILNELYFSLEQLQPGQLVEGTVKALGDRHVDLDVGRVKGYVPHTHLSEAGVFIDPKKARNSNITQKKYKVGQKVQARVLAVDLMKQNLILTMKPSLLAPDLVVLKSYEEAEVGKAYTGIIRFIGHDYLLVTFFNNVTAYIPRMFITQEKNQNIGDSFHMGQIVSCTIISVKLEAQKMSGSLITAPFTHDENREKGKRKQRNSESETPHKKRKSAEQTDNKHTDDEITQTAVKKNKKKKKRDSETSNAEDTEADVKTSKKKKRNSETSTSDEYINSYKETPERKKKKKKQKVVSSSDSDDDDFDDHDFPLTIPILEEFLTPYELGLIDLTDCETVKHFKKRLVAIIKSVEAANRRSEKVTEKIANIEERGLNNKNKAYHTAMQNERHLLKERVNKLNQVKLEVLDKMKELGYERNENYKEEQKKRKLEKKLERKLAKEEGKEKSSTEKKIEVKKETDVQSVDLKEKINDIKVVDSLEPALEVPSAKEFFAASEQKEPTVEEESSSSDDEVEEQPKKKRKKQSIKEKLAKVRAEEDRIRTLEAAATEEAIAPRSVVEFERALMAEPDSSKLWISYMAFYMQSTELDKARKAARNALVAIPFREEQDKLNVWIAMLNLEHRFGTKESQKSTLAEALQLNEPIQVHTALLEILVETANHQELVALVELMQKKYKRQVNVYIDCGAACYKLGLKDKARQVMQKAVSVLAKKEHVSLLVQFALLERKYGGRERAEALFEQVLAIYPQRVDVCSTYLDMLVKDGDVEQARQVLERMTSLQLPARKMKILYKKWIQVEEKLGDETQVEIIRQKAMEFIEKAKF